MRFCKIKNLMVFGIIGIVIMFGSFVIGGNGTDAAFNPQINYQGKLVNPTTNIEVPDGAYDMIFKLYNTQDGAAIYTEDWNDDGTPTTFVGDISVNPPLTGSSFPFTLTYDTDAGDTTLAVNQILYNLTKKDNVNIIAENDGSNTITVSKVSVNWAINDEITTRPMVKDGLFSVMIGTLDSLPDTIFNQDLWLGVTIEDDNEMTPRKKLGAVPAAFEAGKLGGKAETAFGTLSEDEAITGAWTFSNLLTVTEVPTGAGVSQGSLYINPVSSTADYTLLGLAVNGSEKFRLDADGDLTMAGDLTVSGGELYLTGVSSSSSTTEGTMYYDTDTDQLMVYANGKWQADRTTATKIVAANDSSNKEKADYVCSGANDEVQINTAVSALDNGGVVYLLEGTYTIGGTITIDYNNTTLQGSGKATHLNASLWSGGHIIDLNGKDYLTIRDLQIEGKDGGGNSNDLIYGSGVTNSVFENLYLHHSDQYGIYLYTSSDYNHITNCHISNCDKYGICLYSADKNTITGNFVFSSGDYEIYLYGTNFNSVTGNAIDCDNDSLNGIMLDNSSSVNTITGNTIDDCVYHGIDLDSGYTNIINSNVIYSCNLDGIDINGDSNNISENIVRSSGVHGIKITSNNNTIVGNVIYDVGASDDGIKLDAADNNIISSNRIYDTTGSAYGINVSNATCNDNLLIGNEISGAGFASGEINDAGTDTTIQQRDLFEVEAGGTTTALTVTQSSTGNLVDLTGDSITDGTGISLSVDGLTTGTGINITSSSTAGTGTNSSKMLNIARTGLNVNGAHTAYGLYSSVLNTDPGTGTNIAGYFTASGASTANYGLLVAAGNVGIGDSTPSSLLTVGTSDEFQVASSGATSITPTTNVVPLTITRDVASAASNLLTITESDVDATGTSLAISQAGTAAKVATFAGPGDSGTVNLVEISGTTTGTGLTVTQSGTGDIFDLKDGADSVFTVADNGEIFASATTSGNPYSLIADEATTNLVLNPSFEHATYNQNWTAVASATPSDNETYYHAGTHSMKVVTPNSAADEGVQHAAITVSASTTYIGSAFLKGNGTVKLYLTGNVSGDTTTDTINLTDDWTRYFISKTTNATDANLTLKILTPTQQLATFYIDAVQLEAKSAMTTYCDGSLGEGYSWDTPASPHDSASSRTAGMRFKNNATGFALDDEGRLDVSGLTVSQKGSADGEIFRVSGGADSILSVNQAIVEVNQPFSVNVAGDTGINYDLAFLNTGTTFVTSAGPLVIAAGDPNHSENLTITTQSNISGGDSGRATAGDTTTLTDSTKSSTWTADEWADGTISIVSGDGASQTQTVVSNTTTVITVADWDTALGDPDINSYYTLAYARGGDVLVNVGQSHLQIGGFKILGADSSSYVFKVSADGDVEIGGTGLGGSDLLVKQNISLTGGNLTVGELDIDDAGTPTTTVTASGGSCAIDTYYYKITAVNDNGETVGCTQFSETITVADSQVAISWTEVSGATGYKIYRSTDNNDWDADPEDSWVDAKVISSLDTTYTDNCAGDTTSQAPPTTNTTGGGATFAGDVTLVEDSPPDLILDNSTTGADADSGYITWRGNDYTGSTNTELDMSIFLDVTSTTDYKLSIWDDGKASEVASIDQSGNLQIDGDLTSSDTGDIGWSVIANTNPGTSTCSESCTSACVMGFDEAAGAETIVDCSSTAAEKCLCAGAN